MPEGTTGSTVPRRQLGRHLRDLRNRARLTVRAAADALEWSETKIWRIETGQVSLRSFDVEAMCRIYGAPTDQAKTLMELAKETKSKGWWVSYADVIPMSLNVLLGLEEAAARLRWHEFLLIPGILQTEDYSRALFDYTHPTDSADSIERRISVRQGRQASLTRPTSPVRVDIALNEAALRRPIGGRKVMGKQLQHMLSMTELPNVNLRVLRSDAQQSADLSSGPFTMYEFPLDCNGKETEPPVVYGESFTGAIFLDKPEEIEKYQNAFDAINETCLNEASSESLVRAIANDFLA